MSLKLNTRLKAILVLVLAIGLMAVVFWPNRRERGQVCLRTSPAARTLFSASLEIGEKCFFVELARTPEEQAKGLMFRKNLNQDQGMLFIYDQEKELPFWMKNTLIPLDIIWIDQEQRVVFIKETAAPCAQDPCPLIDPGQKARYVWEIPGGRARTIGLEAGDQLELRY